MKGVTNLALTNIEKLRPGRTSSRNMEKGTKTVKKKRAEQKARARSAYSQAKATKTRGKRFESE